MPLIKLLKNTLRQIEESDDARKESPAVLQLKRSMLRAIAKLEATGGGGSIAEPLRPSGTRAAPKPRRNGGTGRVN